MNRQASGKMSYSGGSINNFNSDTILRGKGDFITNIDNDNIVNNRVVFINDDFSIAKTTNPVTTYSFSNISLNRSLYYRKNEIDNKFQNKLIPQKSIKIDNAKQI